MAMTAGNWYRITIGALSTGTNPLPRMEGPVLDAIDAGTEMLVYCITDGTVADIAYLGGRSKVQDAMVTITATPSKNVTAWPDGDVWTSVRRLDGAWLFWSEVGGEVRTPEAADLAALAAFIS